MVSIKDVANYCGVSTSTVSHTLNKTRHVAPETAARIREAVAALGYQPQRNHRLSPGKRLAVGLFSVGFAAWEEGTLRTADTQLGENTRLVALNLPDAPTWEELSRLVKYYHLDRCILHGSAAPRGKPVPATVPVAILDAECPAAWTLRRDWEDGLQKALLYLIKRGHQEICMVTDGLGASREEALFAAFHAVLELYKIDHSGSALTALEWRSAPLPRSCSALVALGPGATKAVIARVKQEGYSIPEDWSLLSIGEAESFCGCFPEITRIRFPMEELSRCLADWVADPAISQPPVIPPHFVLGETALTIARSPSGQNAGSLESLELSSEEIDAVRSRGFGICIATHNGGTLFSRLLIQALTQTCNSLGMRLLATGDAGGSQSLHDMELHDFFLMRPDAIISISNNHNPQLRRLLNIVDSPTHLLLGTDVPRELSYRSQGICVATNEPEKGRMAAQHLALRMLERGRQNIGFFLDDGANFCANQCDGAALRTIEEEFPHMKVLFRQKLGRHTGPGINIGAYLDEHPDLEGIYVYNADMALLAQDALRQRGRGDVLLVTTQINYEIARRCRDDDSIVGISSSRPHEMGRGLALAAAGRLLGLSRPSYIAVDPIIITGDNIEKAWLNTTRSLPPQRENDPH